MKRKVTLAISAVALFIVGINQTANTKKGLNPLSEDNVETLASCESTVGLRLENCTAKPGHKCYAVGGEYVANNCEKIYCIA